MNNDTLLTIASLAVTYFIIWAVIYIRNPGKFHAFFKSIPGKARWLITDIPGKLDAMVAAVVSAIVTVIGWCIGAVLWALGLIFVWWLFSAIGWFGLLVGFGILMVLGSIQSEGERTRDAINRRGYNNDYY